MSPEPIPPEERARLIKADRDSLFADQEPLRGPVSLEEAMARAIKYNLDFRLTAMEQALQMAQLDLTRFDLLPRLVANANFSARSEEDASLSRNTATNFLSVDPSISSDQLGGTADLGLTWNILDFGLSYYQAKQQSDRVLIAEQRRRQVIHTIVQQVRSAYWLAVTAERVQPRIQPVLRRASAAMADTRRAERERLLPPLEALVVQKSLLDVIRQLERLDRELIIAKAQLAALMNLPPGTPYSLALPDGFDYTLPKVTVPVETLEKMALYHRPDLVEEQYQKRITALEARKAVIGMLPGISFTTSYNWDSNSFLINNTWAQAGARASWNLISLLSGPTAIDAAEAQETLADARRLALSVAALTQVHVGVQQYLQASRAFERAQAALSLDRRIERAVRDQEEGDAASPVEAIRSRATALVAEVERDRAFTEVQGAVANLYASAGVDPLPSAVPDHDIRTLARVLKAVNADLEKGRLRMPPVPEAPLEAVPTAAGKEGDGEAPVDGAVPAVPTAQRQTNGGRVALMLARHRDPQEN